MTKKSGRPAWNPSKKQRLAIETMLCIAKQDIVASVLGVDVDTLRKHCREEIEHAKTKKNTAVAAALLKTALGGNVTAQIFWLKTQAGFKETSRVEHAGVTLAELVNGSMQDSQAPGSA